MKLSIIIPMYNAEKYIANCLDSILNSDLPKDGYEVIVVNDGSKDKGPEIVQEYAGRYDNFVYLTQENQGQSVARNYGLTKAKGEYVWFVDSDDKISKHIDEILIKIEELDNPEVFSFYLQYVTEDDQYLTKAFAFEGEYNKLMSGRDAVISKFQPSSVCVYFIKKSYIDAQQLRFYPGIYHQDSEFSYRMMAHAHTVYFSEYVPYIYIRHENSVVTSTSKEKIQKKLLDDIIIVKSFMKLSDEFGSSDPVLSKVIKEHYNNMIFGCVYNLYRYRKMWASLGINKTVISKLKEDGLYPLKGPFDSWKKRLAALFLDREWLIA